MAETAQTSGSGGSLIRINKLKEGYNWSVVVTAGEDEEALNKAKQRAIQIVRDLEQEFPVAKSDDVIPF
jgi:hypothetical protein